MKLEEMMDALAPFARFAELFTHNMLGVDYENFYSKTITVNGEYKEFKISGADFDRAKDALDFLNSLDKSKAPTPTPTEGVELKMSDDPAHNEPAAPAGLSPDEVGEHVAAHPATKKGKHK